MNSNSDNQAPRDFLAAIGRTPLVFDGATGTMFYEAGVFINTCYDELCLTRPEMVEQLHDRYVQAGADVITTNSFGANRIKLGQFGLADKVEQINRRAAELARQAAGDELFVAASIGPVTTGGQVVPDDMIERTVEVFAEQAAALAAGGADAFVLETFSDLVELTAAARATRTARTTRTTQGAGLPVVACFSVDESGLTSLGATASVMASALDACDEVDVIGLNCGTGPAGMYDVLATVLGVARKPVIAMPNAGLPRQVGGRMLYLTSPEYFTEYAKKFIEMGVSGVGGCCGTTPEHIRMMARAVKTISGVKRHVEIRAVADEAVSVAVTPMAEKSRFGAKLAAGEKVTSVELLPPRNVKLTPLLDKARRCADAGVDAINIPDGPRASARISPMIASIEIERQAGIETVLHYCCRDRNLIGMQSDLMGACAAGLRNVLIITGDPPKLGDYPDATGVFDVDAIGLTRMAANLNRGIDLGGATIDPPTELLLGVGANPCAVEPQRELDRYLAKLEAGAEFAITQPVFDPQALLEFLDAVEKFPLRIPVVAGVWPLLSFKNAEFMNNEVPGVVVPDWVLQRMAACTTREESRSEGVRIAREIVEQIAGRVQGFQVSAPLGDLDMALAVLEAAD